MFQINPTEYLADWMVRFLKNRDAFFKKIIDLRQENGRIFVKEKQREITYIIIPFISDINSDIDTVTGLLEKSHVGIVLYNTLDNFRKVSAAWDKLIKIENCTIYFVNPFSKTEKKWIVNPKTHHFISDKDGLKAGLKSMFDMVEPATEEEIRKIIKD